MGDAAHRLQPLLARLDRERQPSQTKVAAGSGALGITSGSTTQDTRAVIANGFSPTAASASSETAQSEVCAIAGLMEGSVMKEPAALTAIIFPARLARNFRTPVRVTIRRISIQSD